MDGIIAANNYLSMDDAELDVARTQLNDALMSRLMDKVAAITYTQKQQEIELGIQKEKINKISESNEKISNELNVIGAPMHSYRAKLIRDSIKQRVVKVLGGVGSIEYILFATYYYKKIHTDLCEKFLVDTFKNINVNEFEKVIDYVVSWYPEKSYRVSLITKLISDKNNKSLSQKKMFALNQFLNNQIDMGLLN